MKATALAWAIGIATASGAGLLRAQTPAPAPAPAPVSATATFDLAGAKAAVTQLAGLLEERFVFPDVGKAYAARLRAQLASGAYDRAGSAKALAEMVTADLQAISPDGHLRMYVARLAAGAVTASASTAAPSPRAFPPVIEQAGWIAPGIAYIRFNAFLGGDEVKQVAAFLDRYEGAKTLIIDARTHHGGGLDEMNVLLPRIYAHPFTAMIMDTRASVAAQEGADDAGLVHVAAPSELYRTEHRVAPGQASPWRDARIFYLTSGRTASAAEHLATVLKYTHRATLVGETTAGAGNYGGGVPLSGGYEAWIPVGHSYFPGTKGWEGAGVAPDVAVAPEAALTEALVRAGVARPEAEALSAAHAPAEPMTRRRPLRSAS